MKTKLIKIQNLDATKSLGEKMGRALKGDEILALVGPLGAGKTSFTQGLAVGFGVDERVISPTFVLERIYKPRNKKRQQLHHFDLYRIEPTEVESTGLWDVLGQSPTVIEWADKIREALPQDTIWININILPDETREFEFQYSEDQAYLFE